LDGWIATDESPFPGLTQRRSGSTRGCAIGMVLLKNDGNLLPLDKGKIKSIAVIGRTPTRATRGGGSGAVQAFAAVSLLEESPTTGAARRFTMRPGPDSG